MQYFSNKRFFKVMNAANYKNGYQYEDGLNDLSHTIGADGEPFTVYFTDIDNIFCYLNYGPVFREVFIPENVPIIYEAHENGVFLPNDTVNAWHSRIVELGEMMPWTVNNIRYLLENGANYKAGNYNIIIWSLYNNYEVFMFMQEYIYERDPDEWDNITLMLQERGYL